MKKLLCFDYDMTLLNHATGTIPESTLQAIERMRPEWKIVIATGRNMEQAGSAYGLQKVRPDAMVEMNGAKVCAEGSVLYTYFFPPELARELFVFGQERGLCISCQIDHVYYTTAPQPLREFLNTCLHAPDMRMRPAQEALAKPIPAMALVGNVADAQLLEENFPQVRVPLFAQKRGADIIPRSLSKAEGMRHLLRYYQSDFSQVVFFGDSGNDLELMQQAGLGIAMGNAIAPLKEAADYVTDAISENGIWNALERLRLFPQE